MIAINGRFLAHRPTGMQKYARHILERLTQPTQLLQPGRPLRGVSGHLWEQSILPLRTPGRLLWSPCGTGPLAVSRQILTIHDIIPLEHPEWFSKQFAALHGYLVPQLVKRVAHIITVSQYTRRVLMEKFNLRDDFVTAIPNGVDESYYRRSPDEIAQMREVLNLPDGPYVLSLCSLEPRKNLPRLLKAWQYASRNCDGTLVVAGGKGGASVFADAGIKNIPSRVHFTGYVNEEYLPALYSGASCFAYPSLYEGFGLPVLEAMACGVPVVTSNSTSLPEVCDQAVEYVNPKDLVSIGDALIRLLNSPGKCGALAEAGIEQASRFTWTASAAATENLLLNWT